MPLLPLLYQFLWVRGSCKAWLSVLLHGLPRQQSVRWGHVLIWGWTGEGYVSKLQCLLAEFSSFQPVGLRASVPCWLWVRGHPQFLDSSWPETGLCSTWASPVWLSASWKPAREGIYKTGITVLRNLIVEAASCHLCCVPLVSVKSQAPLTLRGGSYTVVWTPEGGATWPTLESSHHKE